MSAGIPIGPVYESLMDFLQIEPPVEHEWAEYVGAGWEYMFEKRRRKIPPPARIRVMHIFQEDFEIPEGSRHRFAELVVEI